MIVVVTFSCRGDTIPEDGRSRGEGLHWLTPSLRAQSFMVAPAQPQQCEAAGHMVSAVRKQREESAGAQQAFFLFISQKPLPQEDPPSQLTSSGEPFPDTPRGLSPTSFWILQISKIKSKFNIPEKVIYTRMAAKHTVEGK